MKRGDDGHVLVLFALTLTVLLGMAALAVDVGVLYLERRHDQTAVDNGALGGALDLQDGVDAASEAAAAIIRTNLRTTYTDAEWAAQWSSCTDEGHYDYTGTVLGEATDCISLDGLGTMRVQLPDQFIDTAFASVLGIATMQSSAFAEVDVSVAGVGGVLPFAVLGSASTGSQICMRSSSGGTATPPCTGADSGNFGALQVPQWGNPESGTDELTCNLNKTDQLAVNISVGIDHFVRIYDGTAVNDSCDRPFGPNALPVFTGISGGLYPGMITGASVQGVWFDGRLGRTSGSLHTVDLRHKGDYHTIDDSPLWEYIPYGKGTSVPATCTRESFEATVIASGATAANAQLPTCLNDYTAGSGYADLFDIDANDDGVYDIELTPRFGVVPQFVETAFPSGSSAHLHVGGFRLVYIDALYFGCDGSSCDTVHTPRSLTGPVSLPNGGSPLDQISGLLLPNEAFPDELLANGINGGLGAFRIRLSQ